MSRAREKNWTWNQSVLATHTHKQTLIPTEKTTFKAIYMNSNFSLNETEKQKMIK